VRRKRKHERETTKKQREKKRELVSCDDKLRVFVDWEAGEILPLFWRYTRLQCSE
jgi:hypothetical protein